jgi:anti-sigma-K factor RskA
MNCEELRDYYGKYALGAAGEPQRGEIRAHLDRGCEVCIGGVKRAMESAAPPQRIGWAPFWAAAAVLSLAAAVYFSGREREFAEDLRRLQDQVRAQTSELARLHQAVSLLEAPDAAEVSFGKTGSATGRIFANRDGVLLIVRNLPALPAGMAFQMWVIPNGGKPVPAGMFRAGQGGGATHVAHRSWAPGDVVAITLENEAGATRPASAPIVAVPLPR